MPLLDHFHPPLSERRHWEAFHSRWAGAIADRRPLAGPTAVRRARPDVDGGLRGSVSGNLPQPSAPGVNVAMFASEVRAGRDMDSQIERLIRAIEKLGVKT